MKLILVILSAAISFGATPLTGPFTTTPQYNTTNRNLGPNGLNAVFNSIWATNLYIKTPGSTTERKADVRFGEKINVLDYGAVGDGIADDSAAIQAAIDAMSAYGKELVVPYGDYKITNITFNPTHYARWYNEGTFYSTNHNAIIVGGTDVKVGYDINGLRLINTNANANTNAVVGLCLKNLQQANISLPLVTGFGIPVLQVGDVNGFAYNEIDYGQIWGGWTNIFITATNGGYNNDNIHRGASVSWNTVITNMVGRVGLVLNHVAANEVNAQSFHGFKFEAHDTNTIPFIDHGWNTEMVHYRLEGIGNPVLTTNILRRGFYKPSYADSQRDPIDNAGFNTIWTDSQYKMAGGPGDYPVMMLKNISADNYPALGILNATGTETNIYLYGDGLIRAEKGNYRGTDGEAANGLIFDTSSAYRFQIWPVSDDSIHLAFNAARIGTWISGGTSGNFKISKEASRLNFDVSSAIAAGADITWTNISYLQDNGVWVYEGPIVYRIATGTDKIAYFDSGDALREHPNIDITHLDYLTGLTTNIVDLLALKATAFTTAIGVTNIANVLSAVLEAGSNVTFTTNGNAIVIAAASQVYNVETNHTTIALGDLTAQIVAGADKNFWYAPYGLTIKSVEAYVHTASSSGVVTVDIHKNGTTILSTKLTVDASENTSATAASPAVISDNAGAKNDRYTFDIDTAGTAAIGPQVRIYYTQN